MGVPVMTDVGTGIGLGSPSVRRRGGGGVTTTPHTHWRIVRVAAQHTTYTALMELDFGGNPTVGGTAIASSFHFNDPANSPDNAFDGDVATRWIGASNDTDGAYVGYIFPEPVAIGYVTVTAAQTSYGNNYTPHIFRVEHSDDGVSWELAWLVSIPYWTQFETRTFIFPDPSSAWVRVYNQAVADNWICLYDPSNPNTRIIREDAGVKYIEAIADALGNRELIEQRTATAQPILVPNHFGGLDGMDHVDDTVTRTIAVFYSQYWIDVPPPWTKIGLMQSAGGSGAASTQMYYGSNYMGHKYDAWVFLGGGEIVPETRDRDNNPHIITGIHNQNGVDDHLNLDSKLIVSRLGSSIGAVEDRWLIGAKDSNGANPAKGFSGLSMIRADADEGAITRMQDLLHELTTIPKAA